MNLFHQTITASIELAPGNQELAEIFLGTDSQYRRYLVGKNDQAASLINHTNIDGLIDDFAAQGVQWNRVPVVSSVSLPKDSIVVNCATSISPVSVDNMLRRRDVKNILNIHEVIHASRQRLQGPWFVSQMRLDYKDHLDEWYELYQRMGDEESRKTLIDVMRYRLTADPRYMMEYNVRLSDQYFDRVMAMDSEVFVDVGGFDGDTTEEFIKRCPNYSQVFFFEPSMKNMVVAQERLKKFSNIKYLPFGLSDEPAALKFAGNDGSASSIAQSGEDVIQVTTLDDTVNDPVTIVKMDVEGWELKALRGCRAHIIEDKPKLAVAAYHRASDFRDIPAQILGFNSHQDVFLRHYTEGWSETVMYFKPHK